MPRMTESGFNALIFVKIHTYKRIEVVTKPGRGIADRLGRTCVENETRVMTGSMRKEVCQIYLRHYGNANYISHKADSECTNELDTGIQ